MAPVHSSVKILHDGGVGVSPTCAPVSQLKEKALGWCSVLFRMASFLFTLATSISFESVLRACILVVNEHAEELFRVGIVIQLK